MKPAIHMPARRVRKLIGFPEPVLQFRIYPEDRCGGYFTVQVYRTWRQLARLHRLYWPKRRDHFTWGFVALTRRPAEPKHLGVVCFYLRSCSDATVPHEFFHAAMAWAEGLRMAPKNICGWASETHERVAEAHCWMVREFWRQFTRHGFKRVECWGWLK